MALSLFCADLHAVTVEEAQQELSHITTMGPPATKNRIRTAGYHSFSFTALTAMKTLFGPDAHQYVGAATPSSWAPYIFTTGRMAKYR